MSRGVPGVRCILALCPADPDRRHDSSPASSRRGEDHGSLDAARKLLVGAGLRRRPRRPRSRAGRAREARGRGGARAPSRRRGSRWIRSGRSPCPTIGSWARRSAWRSTRGTTSGSSIGAAHAQRSGPRSAPPTNPKTAEECCLPAPPVLEFDPAGNLVGHWGGPGKATSGRRRTTGITVDHKGNVWIGGNDAKDAHVAEVHQGRQVPDAVRAPGQEHRQQRHRELRAGGQDLRRPEGQRGVHRRRLWQQARGRDRRRHRKVQAVLGRLRQQARRHGPRQRTIPTPRPPSSSAPRCTAPSSRTTGSCTSATARTTGSRSSRRTASS